MASPSPSLCASYFPLLPSFQDLELPTQCSQIFAIDATKVDGMDLKQQQKKMKSRTSSVTLLNLYLRNPEVEYANLGFDNEYHSSTFIEVVYAYLKASKLERRIIPSMDILLRLLKALLHFATVSMKELDENPATDLRKKNLNNLRVCIFYLCHGLCISEDVLQQEQKHMVHVDAVHWLELKSRLMTVLHKILESVMWMFNQQEAKIAGALICTAAISCLIHQKWNLRKMLISILCHPFLYPLNLASEVADKAYKMLFSISEVHKNLIPFVVDMIAHMMSQEQSVGIAFLSRIVNSIQKDFDAVASGKGDQMYDKTDFGLSVVAEFSLREDALMILGVYSVQLLPLLKADRAATRKYVIDIIGGSLACYHHLSLEDQHALLNLYSFLMQDRDAICRLKALTYLGTLFTSNSLLDTGISNAFTRLVLKKIADKSKVVRLKALQVLESILLNISEPSGCLTLGSDIESLLVTKVAMLLSMPVDSPYFCRDTGEASAKLLCTECLRVSVINALDTLLGSEHCSARFPVISRLLHFHLNDYDGWVQFLASRSEKSIKNLQRFLTASPDDHKEFIGKFKNMVNKALQELDLHESNASMLLGSLRLISLFLSFEAVMIQISNERINTIISILMNYIGELKPLTDRKEIKKCIIMWILKTLAIMARRNKKIFTRETIQVLTENFVSVYNEGIEGSVDCIFSLSNPGTITKNILQIYEEKIQVLNSSQPLKVLRGYILFIGDLSQSYQFACDAFVKCLREARKQFPGFSNNIGTLSDFDYMQEEEQKTQEEDAVLRFSSMLLDGNSAPGCYVPLLDKLVSSDSIPKFLRLSAIQSLGRYTLTSINMAEKYKATIEALLQSEVPEIKRVSLELAESLILAFPNEYSSVLTLVLSLLQNDAFNDAAAFNIYARLVLDRKFKLDMLLGPICGGLCGDSENIHHLAISLLKMLSRNAGKSKHKLVVNLWNHCRNREACKRLTQVIVEHVLDITDLKSDELASLTLQILALGENGIAFLARFLHPSYKVLQTLDLYLSTCPPKVNLKGDIEATECLIQFVRNCKRWKEPYDKEMFTRVLHRLQAKSSSKKRKSQGFSSLKTTQSAYDSLEDYEKAIESFKQCDITGSMWEIVSHEV